MTAVHRDNPLLTGRSGPVDGDRVDRWALAQLLVKRVSAREGEPQPAAPRGYNWRLVAVDEPWEVARCRL